MKLCKWFASDKEVFRYGKINRRNAHILCIPGRTVLHRSVDTFYTYLAGFEVIDACKTFDKCGLSGSVLSHKCMDLAPAQCQIHIIKSFNAGKSHCNAARCKHNIFFHVPSPFCCLF